MYKGYTLQNSQTLDNFEWNRNEKMTYIKLTLPQHAAGAANKPIYLQLPDQSQIRYRPVHPAHIIDEKGVGIYEPRQTNPKCKLPDGMTELKQWQFDKYLYENGFAHDTNYAVWKAFVQYMRK